MSDPATLELLQKIDQRLERLEQKVNESEELFLNGLSIAGDAIDQKFNPEKVGGLENMEKFKKVQSLLEKLTEQENLKALETLIDNLKNLSTIVVKLQQLDNGVSMGVDAIDEFFGHAMRKGVDIEEFATNLKRFSYLLIDVFESGALADLLDSGILDTNSIETVGALGKSMSISSEVRSSAGPTTALAALFNKDIQRTLGFALTFATHFGKTLDNKKSIKLSKN
jgi:uncharacterized protein YjgD (DUF1641 family)